MKIIIFYKNHGSDEAEMKAEIKAAWINEKNELWCKALENEEKKILDETKNYNIVITEK